MSKPRVYVTRRVPEEGLAVLSDKCDVTIWDSDDVVPRKELLEKVAGVSGIFCTINDVIDKEVLNAAGPSLKVVGTMSVGQDHIDVQACEQQGVCVAGTPDVASDSAAELSVTLLLMTIRRIAEGMAALKAGTSGPWKPMWMLGNVSMGKTLGIFGFGRVGFGIARRMKPFGVARIIYNDLFTASFAKDMASWVTFDELVRESDILCICCPVTPQTVERFDLEVFKKMKKTAVLINTARGAIVKQDDLVVALQKNMIRGAGLDVTNPEPLPPTHPLMTLPNCTVLPHLGTNTQEARTSMSVNTARNIIAMLDVE